MREAASPTLCGALTDSDVLMCISFANSDARNIDQLFGPAASRFYGKFDLINDIREQGVMRGGGGGGA